MTEQLDGALANTVRIGGARFAWCQNDPNRLTIGIYPDVDFA